MTTRQILIRDTKSLNKVNQAIKSLESFGRPKDLVLRDKFLELRENLEISIESNKTALKMGL